MQPLARSYGQFCGLARAADVLGERWALLIVRDLLVSPKRFGDLSEGLPGIPTNVLTSRLRELEAAGVVRRVLAAPPARSVLYELTEYGQDLEEIMVALGRWGARRMARPELAEVVTDDSLAMAIRSAFQPAGRAVTASYEVRVADATAHAHIAGSSIRVGAGSLPEADLRIVASAAIRDVLAGRLTAHEAVHTGAVTLDGKRRLFDDFVRVLRVPLDEAGPDPAGRPQPVTATQGGAP